MARYAWNMALGAALYSPLQILEVALRNTLHDALTQHHNDARWYANKHALRIRSEKDTAWMKVQAAVTAVQLVTPLTAPDAPGRIIAELDFGFWTTLLTRRYASPVSVEQKWSPIWPALLPIAFPHFPNTATKRDRETIAKRFGSIRQLRNRVSHHEPIWKGHTDPNTQKRTPLTDHYNGILEALGWIHPDAVQFAEALSTFPSVYAKGIEPYKVSLGKLP